MHPLARQALVLLGLMTLACAGGPVLIALTLAGGRETRWPPDRPIEWVVLVGTVATVVVLMAVAVGIGLANARRQGRGPEGTRREG
jgi:hypothetical protein